MGHANHGSSRQRVDTCHLGNESSPWHAVKLFAGVARGEAAALVSIVVGLTVRLVLFVMTPTMYGLDNTILYIPNGVFDASFDGWPTFIAFAASLVTYVAVALVTPVAPIRGLDVRVAEDLDDALGEVDTVEPEPELVKADAGPRLPTAP